MQPHQDEEEETKLSLVIKMLHLKKEKNKIRNDLNSEYIISVNINKLLYLYIFCYMSKKSVIGFITKLRLPYFQVELLIPAI